MADLAHVTITTADLEAAAVFYDAALGALGLTRVVELCDEEEDDAPLESIAWGVGERAIVWLVRGAEPTRAVHVCLGAGSRRDVERFHAAGLAAGGSSHDAPRRWPIYRAGQFNAILADPDGNLFEAVSAE